MIVSLHSLPYALILTIKILLTAAEPVHNWIDRERWTLMPELTYGILYDIGNCCNHLLVMGVLDVVEKTKKNSPVKKWVVND